MTNIVYTAPPTMAAFMQSEALIRAALGPVGSGKTTAVMMELLRRACEQHPGPDGIRRTRFAILRQTLSQLKQTVLKDIAYWFNGIARWKVSESTVFFEFLDVHSEWILLPLEEPEDQRRLLSMQLTGAWISEGIEIDFDLIAAIQGRCGRYPGAAEGGTTWYGIVIDSNMPTEGTPWHNAIANPPPDWDVYIQPGGLQSNAENLEWLLQTPETLKLPITDPLRLAQGRLYYERLARNKNTAWVQRYVHAQFGPDPSGAAVFGTTFRTSFHCVDHLEPVRNMPLIVGQDFGRDPWSIITQIDNTGKWLVLEEVEAHDTGLTNHLRISLRPALMHQRYAGLAIVIVGDPAGAAKSQYDEFTAFDIIRREGFTGIPAGTNDIETRLDAVEMWLLQQRMGGPAILFDRSRCPRLVEGMSGMYRYSKTTLDVSKPKPDKNPWSHVCDGLQYAALGTQGGTARQIARRLRGRNPAPARFSAKAWT